jgi:hypothetical protein
LHSYLYVLVISVWKNQAECFYDLASSLQVARNSQRSSWASIY